MSVFVSLPSRKKPGPRWATPLLLTLMLLAFAGLALLPNDASWRETLLRWGTLSGSVAQWRDPLSDQRALTLLSALFIHASWWHLLGNLVFLLIFAFPVERGLGPWRLLTLFLLCGALANLAAALLLGEPGRTIVGASGAISAVIGAYLALFPQARLGIVVPLGLWLEFIRAPAALLIALWVGLQLAFTWIGPSFGTVAWSAHVVGFVSGLVLALFWRPAAARRLRGHG